MQKTIIYKSNFPGMFISLLVFITVLLILGIKEKGSLCGLFVVGIFIVMVLRFILLTPHTVILEQNMVSESSFLHTKTFKAHLVKQIIITKRITGTGDSSRLRDYIEIHTANDHVISFEYFYGKSPDVYEILQGWHSKHKSRNQAD